MQATRMLDNAPSNRCLRVPRSLACSLPRSLLPSLAPSVPPSSTGSFPGELYTCLGTRHSGGYFGRPPTYNDGRAQLPVWTRNTSMPIQSA
eukprot:7956570-Alexandrium_andersonii.AAC.1